MKSTSLFSHIPEENPEQAVLCLPVYEAATGRFKTICTQLREFPVYLLKGGVRDFFKALVLQHWQKPLDWQFVEDIFDEAEEADGALPSDELDIVQKRFVMWMKRRDDRAVLYELH
jgi:hypothetical protein